jgi:Tol biopolymer transport system component
MEVDMHIRPEQTRRKKLWSGFAALVFAIAGLGISAVRAAVPATNGKIAFQRWDAETDRGQVFTVDPDGAHEAQIGASDDVITGDWSPDGTRLLVVDFSTGEGARPAIASPDGSVFTILNAYPKLHQSLECGSWSPDGRRLLCSSTHHDLDGADPSDDGVYTTRSSDGGDLRRVTAAPTGYIDTALGYSPDGSRILFNRIEEASNWGILYAVDPDGSDLVRLSSPDPSVIDLDFFDGISADWSPDGSRVAFAAFWKSSTGNGRQNAIFVVNADGSGRHQITPSGIGGISAQWSPDGRLIAFTTKRRSHPEVYVVRPDGTGLRPIDVPSEGAISLTSVWSPDGQRLLFFRDEPNGQEDLWTVNVDGTRLAQLGVGSPPFFWGTAPTG